MEKLVQHIESLIFASDQPVPVADIKKCLEAIWETSLEDEILQNALEELMTRYQEEQFAFELLPIAGGYQFLTKGAFHHTVSTLLQINAKKRLSQAALETLAIIAYKQPVSKSEIEKIRGVNCDYAIQKLLEKELVSIAGRSDGPGRPLVYATSEKFMNYFGIQSLKDLPQLKDFKEPDQSIGEPAPLEEYRDDEPNG